MRRLTSATVLALVLVLLLLSLIRTLATAGDNSSAVSLTTQPQPPQPQPVLREITDNNHSDKSRNEQVLSEPEEKWTSPLSVFTFFLALATIGLAVATGRLVAVTRKLVEVEIDPILDHWFEQPGGLMSTSLVLRNSGAVPIVNIEMWTSSIIFGGQIDFDGLVGSDLMQRPGNPLGRWWNVPNLPSGDSTSKSLDEEVENAAKLIKEVEPTYSKGKPDQQHCLLIITMRYQRKIDFHSYSRTIFGIVGNLRGGRAVLFDPYDFSNLDTKAVFAWLRKARIGPESSITPHGEMAAGKSSEE
jgi:hypothetical protein